jgi:cholesterol transport system auxiliary component
MNMHRSLRGAAGALLLLLAACGGLLGGGGRADLYRFGSVATPDPPPSAPATFAEGSRPALLLYPGASFERAIEGDRILTVTGAQAAYVAEARWVAPASDLFDAVVSRTFEQRTPAARVVRLRGAPLPDYAIGIDVRRFEADYVGGALAPPEIVVEARLRLMRWSDRAFVDEWPIQVREPAAENRLQSIVDAFDRATAVAVARMADQTQQALVRQPRLAQRTGEPQ